MIKHTDVAVARRGESEPVSPTLTVAVVEKILEVAGTMGVESPDPREVILALDNQCTNDFTALASDSFDGGIIEVTIGRGEESDYESGIQFAGSGVMSATEYREMADQYELFPAWLRAWADRVDAITGTTVSTIEVRDAADVDGRSYGFKEAWLDSAFSTNYRHQIENSEGDWRVCLVEPNRGDSLTIEDARRFLAEAAAIVAIAERLTTTGVK